MANEVGTIGTMYENRKSKKVGVLEERNEKYKTLMMRDSDGNTFNVTYSTFKSNWRKYTGDEVIQTSAQVEEAKEEKTEEVETKENKHESKKDSNKKSNVKKLTSQQRVEMVYSVSKVVKDIVDKADLGLSIRVTSKGAIIVKHRRYNLFEIWTKCGYSKYDVIIRDDVVSTDREKFNSIIEQGEYSYHDDWRLKHMCRIDENKLENVLTVLLDISKDFVATRNVDEKEEE